MRSYKLKAMLEQQQVPKMALVVYQNDKSQSIYIESHRISKQGRMLAGKPLTQKCIAELVESFSVEQATMPHGKIPPNMLYCDTRKGHERYVWYNPPQKRMMFFSQSLNIANGEYHLPGIIYDTNGERLDVYAFKTTKPKADTPLYKVPLFNVTNESVCLGNPKIDFPDNPTFEKFLLYWEKKFWHTEFTHLGGSRSPTKNNLVVVTKQMTDSFDYKELMPIHKDKSFTLSNLLR